MASSNNKPSVVDIQLLVRELILPFYELERDLSLPIQNHRNETDAEHSWSLAFLTLALAPKIDSNIDVFKACAFAVLHDLVEVFAGDTSVWAADEKLASKHDRELKALNKIKEDFSNFPNIGQTIDMYEKKDSAEALFVHALDKFLALLLLYEDKGFYYIRGKITQKRFNIQFEPHRKKAQSHGEVARYYEKLRSEFDAHPEYFFPEDN